MKLTASRVEAYLKRPDPGIPTVLLYGPDQGLVGERAKRLLATVITDPEDPFLIAELDGDALRQNPGLLVEEAQALSLMGGRRAVRLRQSADVAQKALQQLLELEIQEAFVVIEAGELGPSAPLRRLIERAKNAMAVPCYREEGRGLLQSIEALLKSEGLKVDRDALAYLQDHLGADHGITRREIEKLATFAQSQTQPLGLLDVASIVGDASAIGIDDLTFAILARDHARAERVLERLLSEGANPIAVIRPIARFMLRLYGLKAEVGPGKSAQDVVACARPPIHFRRKQDTQKALKDWSLADLAGAIDALGVTELRMKRTGSPAALCCRHTIAELTTPASQRLVS